MHEVISSLFEELKWEKKSKIWKMRQWPVKRDDIKLFFELY